MAFRPVRLPQLKETISAKSKARSVSTSATGSAIASLPLQELQEQNLLAFFSPSSHCRYTSGRQNQTGSKYFQDLQV